jgi:NAD(P)-dependent dehydrogenase (short-subunit alcohol dehydrogenase family)
MLLLGTPVDAVRALADGLGAALVEVPVGADDAALEAWRDSVAGGSPVDAVVVAPWLASPAPGVVDDLTPEAWASRCEDPLAAWVLAMGAAAGRVADGGVIVAVVERPAPLDSFGWAPESAISDGVEALTRSLGRSEGPRGVRVHAVTTPARLTTGEVVQPSPPLASFPGSLERDVVGAVRVLLSDEVAGLTGQVVHADAGRSWR